jgi:DNA (cytosine-5)-methyltransferase 1
MTHCKYISIDLFAGAGGMTQGFKQKGFQPIFANDQDKSALATFHKNHPAAIASAAPVDTLKPSALREEFKLSEGKLDLLIGGPPCQGFSTYGKRNPQDYRNRLYQYVLTFIEEFRPKAFVMENVVGILSLERGQVVEEIVKQTEKLGYGVSVVTLDAVEFGVPQFRKRVFILGGCDRQPIPEPSPTHTAKHSKRYKPKENSYQISLFPSENYCTQPEAISVYQAIADLPEAVFPPKLTHHPIPYPDLDALSQYQQEIRKGSKEIIHHSAKRMLGIRRLRLALMRPGDYGTKIRCRLEEGGLSNELIDELLVGKDGLRNLNECRRQDREKEQKLRKILQQGHVNIDEVMISLESGGFANKYRRLDWNAPSHTLVAHMARDCSDFIHPQYDRFLSVREAARLQSFPDNYYFCGSQFQQFKQIGNAVPPKLAEAIASQVVNFLGSRSEVQTVQQEFLGKVLDVSENYAEPLRVI